MAGTHSRKRMAPQMTQIFVFIHIFNIISTSLATVESHGQAFIQTDNELRYMGDHIDGVPLHISGKDIHDTSLQDGATNSGPIRFDPPSLDFREQPVGMPHMEQVTVHNPDSHTNLHLLSISGSTLHFHCSFFQDKMVPPGGNTTFDVVFLARQQGAVENTLYIHTTLGSFKYLVTGVGVPNPYRIRPFLGAKVPLNTSFSPLIKMHNPHNSVLQVVEMYSSGGDLHLELPTGEKEAPKNLWEIAPYETKPVMRASFVGRTENNHTAFIRIKTNQDKKDEVLVLPVEVEVTSSPGIYSPLEMLDFGILRSHDQPKTLRLNLINSGNRAIHLNSISVSPPNDAIHIEFRPIKLQPDIIQPTPVALISFSAAWASTASQSSGKIVVKSKSGQYRLSVPYQATVLHGSLLYPLNQTMFYTGQPPFKNMTRDLNVTNTFNFTVVIYNVSLPDEGHPYFSVENVTSPLTLRPQETVRAFRLRFHPNSTHLHLSTHLRLATNASIFVFPITVYNGKLKVVHHRPGVYKGHLEFGTLGMQEKRSMTFTLRNDNPVDIIIREFSANMEKTSVELLGVEKGNGTTLTRKHNPSDLETNPLVLKPYHFAVFSVNLVAPSIEGTFTAEVIIVTQFENLYIPLNLQTAEGSLNAVSGKVAFENCFPSKRPHQDLWIHSSFSDLMEVRHITFQPNDSRFYYERPPGPPHITLLEPHKDNNIGRIFFDAKKECREDCYVGLPTYLPAGHQWLLGASLHKDVADTDQYLYTRFQQKWQLLGQHQLSTINVTLQLDTNQVRGFLFPAQAHLHWPSMVKTDKIKFPLTQIGNMTTSVLSIENPADVPVLIQILPLSLYPSPQTIIDLVSHRFPGELSDYIEMDDLDVFSLQDLEIYKPGGDNKLTAYRKAVESSLGVKPHRHAATMMLEAGRTMDLKLSFVPRDDLARTSFIIIRNNLTILDVVLVQGQGGRGEMRFSNKRMGSSMPLVFDMTEKHLKNCEKKKQSKSSPASFTVKRTFTARNTGQLPFYVHGFSISDSSCEGYGFKVFDCQGFELLPNSSKKIDIAFTPDFTMSRMRRTLSVHTSLGAAINYTLQASIPPHMLTKCAAALPRPPWEPILYYTSVCIMAFFLLGTLIAAYCEADRIFTADIHKRRAKLNSASQAFDKGRVFDLRYIAGVRSGTSAHHSPMMDSKNTSPQPSAVAAATATPQQQQQQKAPVKDVNTSPKDHPQMTTPTLTHPTNNHSPPPTTRSSPHLLLRPFVFLKSIFVRSKTTTGPSLASPVAHVTERPITREKEVKNGIANNCGANPKTASPDKVSSGPDHTDNNSKTTNYKVTNNRRSKAAKRQHTDLITDTNSTTAGKDGKRNSGPTRRLVADLDQPKPLPDKDYSRSLSGENKTTANSVPTASRKADRTTGMNQLDIIDTSDVTLPTEELEDSKKDTANKKLRQRKSRKVESRDRRSKERLRQELLMDNDKDDASSTTTESSSAEADDKTSSARESTPEPIPTKKKSRGKDKKRADQLDDENDDDFVITSKSRAHKNIKIDPKNSFGGNIHQPSTYELPYTTKLEAAARAEPFNSKMDAKSDRSDSSSSTSTERPSKKSSKNKNVNKSKMNVCEDDEEEEAEESVVKSRSSSNSSSDGGMGSDDVSPSPAWDTPFLATSYLPDGDLTELSLQTQLFAAKHSKPMAGGLSTGGHGSSPDPLSPSSRSSSYSSVVSNGSNDNSMKNKYQGMPTDPQKKGYDDLKHPGAIGTRALSPKPLIPPAASQLNQPPTGMHKNPWAVAPGNPTSSADALGSLSSVPSYGLHTIREGPSVIGAPHDDNFPKNTPFDDGLGGQPNFMMGAGNTFEQPVTMMQRLRLERRKRLLDYQQRLVHAEDWPGFNLPPQHQSLWDNIATEHWAPGAGLAGSTLPPQHQVSAGMWESALGPSTSGATGWTNDVSSIWSSSTTTPPSDSMLSSEPTTLPPTDQPPATGSNVGSFDPFNTLGNALGSIWRPSSNSGTNTWGFSKPDDID